MVDGIFYIRGENIFEVGLRFSLVELAANTIFKQRLSINGMKKVSKL